MLRGTGSAASDDASSAPWFGFFVAGHVLVTAAGRARLYGMKSSLHAGGL